MFPIPQFYTFKDQPIGIIFKVFASATTLVYIFSTIYTGIIACVHSIIFITPLTYTILIIPITT